MKRLACFFALVVVLSMSISVAYAYKTMDKPVVAISVDDGGRTLYDNVYPLMLSYDIPFTAYIVTSYVGDSDHITWDQLWEMYWSGILREVGNHSRYHVDPTGESTDRISGDIRGAQIDFSKYGFLNVTGYAYPLGISNMGVLSSLKAVGLSYGRGSFDQKSKFNLPRNFNRWWIESVSYRTPRKHADMKPIIDEAVANNAGLSIVLHDVFPGANGEYQLDSAELEKTLAYLSDLRAQGKIEIVSVSQLAEKLSHYKSLR